MGSALGLPHSPLFAWPDLLCRHKSGQANTGSQRPFLGSQIGSRIEKPWKTLTRRMITRSLFLFVTWKWCHLILPVKLCLPTTSSTESDALSAGTAESSLLCLTTRIMTGHGYFDYHEPKTTSQALLPLFVSQEKRT
jgi:hypothetical protein